MTTITYAPDPPDTAIVLSQTGRDWMEMDIHVNHHRVLQPVEFFRAAYGTNIDRGNWRNTISFKTWRGLNAAGASFADYEEALLMVLDHPNSLPKHGYLVITVQGATTSGTRYLLDCSPTKISTSEQVGITIPWQYSFTGGQITDIAP